MLNHGSYSMWNISVKEILSQCLMGLWNKTSIVINKPSIVINKPSIVINKTSIVINKPSIVINKTNIVINKTSIVINKTSIVINKTKQTFSLLGCYKKSFMEKKKNYISVLGCN